MGDKPQNDIATRVETIGSLMGRRLFQPASIQRDFKWEAANCVALFEDIYRVFSAHYAGNNEEEDDQAIPIPSSDELIDADLSGVAPPIDMEIEGPPNAYLLGPMYLAPPKNGISEVYDGLQRLTSLTILISVLRDRISLVSKEWGDWLHTFVEDEKWGYRLTYPTKSHKETGTARWLSEMAQRRGESIKARRNLESKTPRGRVTRAIREFRRLTQDMSPSELTSFAEFMMTRVRIVAIQIADMQLARQAFVTSNQRGVALSSVDILKGVLMDIAGNDERAAQVKDTWDRISTTPDLENFMSAVDFIERRAQQGPSHLVEFGDYLAEARPGFAILEWMDRLEALSASWRTMKSALFDPQKDPFEGDLWRLGLQNWNEWKPLALHFVFVYQQAKKENNKRRMDTVISRFSDFHRRAMAISLAGLGAKARHTIIRRAIEQSEGLTGDGKARNCMSLSYGALRLKPTQKDRAQRQLSTGFDDYEARVAFLRWLESLHWTRDALPDYVAGGTVEHVMPTSPAPEAKQWAIDFPDPDARLGLCNMLGNLILIDKETNHKAGSGDFSEKVQFYREMRPPFAMSAEVAELSKWRPQDIVARSERMREFALEQLDWDNNS
ncbi:DUF262 domain-containing protein [Hirschia maritima]|uniref:DUF262 domain-containing protein n=1 Tax=Hirschia maritima TaxID=1121961 RepID=UPI00037C67DD|nr:DUF262 domain-containing HNH endonuclease family protein [Hirschia maritima]